MGDVVLSTPIYHTLKLSFPGSFVAALVSPYTSPLLKSNPFIDAVITDQPPIKQGGTSDFWKKVREIRAYRFDTALLLMPTERLAYMLFFAGIRNRVGVGHIFYEVITMMRGVSRRKYTPLRHESDYMLDLARKIGAKKIWPAPELFLDMEEKDEARRFLELKGFNTNDRIVIVHPGSGHSSPNWEVDRYVELARMLSAEGLAILVTGGTHEKWSEASFNSIGGSNLRTSFGELTLRELASVVSQSCMLISSSTGPMHIAAGVGTPTVSLFCPMTACSPKLWGPVGNRSEVVLPPDDFCHAKCPGGPHNCTFGDGTEGTTVNTVFDIVMRSLMETRVFHPRDL